MALTGETLFTMRGAVKSQKDNAPGDDIDRAINRRIRAVCNRHHCWSDLLAFGSVGIPAAYKTGTVSTNPNSNIIVGAGTGWPVNDVVNTTGPVAIRQPGYARVKPASMAKLTAGRIQPGDWLLIDSANSTLTEAVVVEWTSSDGTTFVAKFLNTHDPNYTITKSSLSNLQFISSCMPFTVQAVIDATHAQIDNIWGAPALSGAAYTISLVFFQIDPYATRLKFAWDWVQGIPLDVDNYTFDQIIIGDPQLSTSDNPTLICPTPAGAGGVNQWMMYPPQTSGRQIGVVYKKTWPKLLLNDDVPPPILDPECFIAGAKADMLRTKIISQRERVDPYYDPNLAEVFEGKFKEYVDGAEEQDEAQSHHKLQSYIQTVSGAFSANYMLSHVGAWPSDFPGV